MSNIIKRLIIERRAAFSWQEITSYSFVIILVTYFIAPRFWEPGGETFRSWAVAQNFNQTGEFGHMHASQLYNLYLQLFLSLDYPLSIQLEHFVTHFFCSVSLFLLLSRFLPRVPALLIVCVWIPQLWIIETGARVAAIGFFALYLQSNRYSNLTKGYFPIFLLAAALCENAFLAFLVGHIIGTIIKRYVSKEPMITLRNTFRWKDALGLMVKVSMIILFILPLLIKPQDPTKAMWGFEYPWSPIPSTSVLAIAYLQEGNWRDVMQKVPKSEWYKQDWYFTHEETFGGAQNLLDAVIYNPFMFIKSIISNIPPLMKLPLNFLIGFSFPDGLTKNVLFVFSLVLLPFIFLKSFQYYMQNNLDPRVFSIVIGVCSVIAILSPIFFRTRYFITLLPVGLIFAAHIGTAFQQLIELVHSLFVKKINIDSTHAKNKWTMILCVFGASLILIGIVANEWILNMIIPREIDFFKRMTLLAYELFFVISGVLIILKRAYFYNYIQKRIGSSYSNRQTWLTSAITLIMIGCLLMSSFEQSGINSGFYNLRDNPFLLKGRITSVYHQLLDSISKDSKVLALEDPWIKSFGGVDLDKSYHALYLPPFNDESGETEKFLNGLDVIWVSTGWSTKLPSVSTQQYLRYLLHIEPFLSKALKKGWMMKRVEGFGNIYRKGEER